MVLGERWIFLALTFGDGIGDGDGDGFSVLAISSSSSSSSDDDDDKLWVRKRGSLWYLPHDTFPGIRTAQEGMEGEGRENAQRKWRESAAATIISSSHNPVKKERKVFSYPRALSLFVSTH